MSTLDELARALHHGCLDRELRLATAESCTGGLIAAALTGNPGSSASFDRGFVTYSNQAKIEMLGVLPETLAAHGAVSAEVAREMAEGAIARSAAGLAISVTGIAGPDGGSAEKPVGLVWFGLAKAGEGATAERKLFENRGRAYIRAEATAHALRLLLRGLQDYEAAGIGP